jgi:hypothetical protein
MRLIIPALAVALTVSACSQASLDKLSGNLDRFDQAVERINTSIAKVSPALYAKCQTAQSTGAKLLPLANAANATAGNGMSVINAALRAGCQTAPTDIPSALANVIAAAEAGYQAYLDAKAGAK